MMRKEVKIKTFAGTMTTRGVDIPESIGDYEEACQNAEREAEVCLKYIESHQSLMKSEKSLFRAGFKAGYLSASGETVEVVMSDAGERALISPENREALLAVAKSPSTVGKFCKLSDEDLVKGLNELLGNLPDDIDASFLVEAINRIEDYDWEEHDNG